MGGQPLGFQENLVRILVSKAVDLVLHTWAVARAHAVNLASKHRAAVKAAANDVVRARVGMGDVARHLLGVSDIGTPITEHWYIARCAARHSIARLRNAFAEINRAAVYARRRAGFQSALWQLEFFQPSAQRYGRRVARPARRIVLQTHMNLAVQKRTGRQHHRTAFKLDAHLRYRANHPVAFHQ